MLEFPQSQERFEGKVNFVTWRQQCPAALAFNIRRIRGGGNFWGVENTVRYDGGPWNYTGSLLEFRGAKVARQTICIMPGWGAPGGRAPWAPESAG